MSRTAAEVSWTKAMGKYASKTCMKIPRAAAIVLLAEETVLDGRAPRELDHWHCWVFPTENRWGTGWCIGGQRRAPRGHLRPPTGHLKLPRPGGDPTLGRSRSNTHDGKATDTLSLLSTSLPCSVKRAHAHELDCSLQSTGKWHLWINLVCLVGSRSSRMPVGAGWKDEVSSRNGLLAGRGWWLSSLS